MKLNRQNPEAVSNHNRYRLIGAVVVDFLGAMTSAIIVNHTSSFHKPDQSSGFWAYPSHASNLELSSMLVGMAAYVAYEATERFRRNGLPTMKNLAAVGAIALSVGTGANVFCETHVADSIVGRSFGTPDPNDLWWGLIGTGAATAAAMSAVRTVQPSPTDVKPDLTMPIEPLE